MVVANFGNTDTFLHGTRPEPENKTSSQEPKIDPDGTNFAKYGIDVLKYHYGEELEFIFGQQAKEESSRVDPMCNSFPTMVSCDMNTSGKGGQTEGNNFLCILSQNIINEKIYLVLWFWFVFLMVIGSLQENEPEPEHQV